MSGKRSAGYDLNRDNWDEELPKEEAGTWKPVSDEERKARPILKAKRSLTNKSASESSSPFGVWAFGAPAADKSSISSSPFSCFAFAPKSATPTAQSATPVTTMETKSIEDHNVSESSSSENTVTSSENSRNPTEKRKKDLHERKQKLLLAKARIEQQLKEIEEEEDRLLQNPGGESGESVEPNGNSSSQSAE